MTDEDDLYVPASDFLNLLRLEEITLEETPFGNANLVQLIRLTRDDDASNRDWAVFLSSESERDEESVRGALRTALNDSNEDVRAEALVGLAKRVPAEAEPIVREGLAGEWVSQHIVEAASYVAAPTLLPMLRELDRVELFNPSDGLFRLYLNEAIASCTSSVQPTWRPPWE